MSIYERIKERRKALGLSADDVAEKLGVSRATIYRYESADIEKFPTSSLEPLAEALKTTPAYLMGWTDNPHEDSEEKNQYKFIPPLTEHEIKVLLMYRNKPDMQSAVDTLLGILAEQPEQKEGQKKIVPILKKEEFILPIAGFGGGVDQVKPKVSKKELDEAARKLKGNKQI